MKTRHKVMLGAVGGVLALTFIFWSPQQLRPVAEAVRQRSASTSNQTPVLAPPVLHPPAVLDQTSAVPSPSTGSPRQFSKMGVLEGSAIIDEIAKQDLPSIFQAMLDAERVEHDRTKQLSIATAFTGALQEKNISPEFIKLLHDFIEDKTNTSFERQVVIGVLGNASSKQTLDLLIQIATNSPDQMTRAIAAANIGKAGTGRGGSTQEKLAPAIEQVWHDSSDKDLLVSIADAMAQVGTTSSMELLVTAALERNGMDDIRKQAALDSLKTATILNDHALPPLVQRLSAQAPTSTASELAANTLARIQIPAAAQALVTWLQNANASAAPLVYVYVMQTQSEDIWQAALAPAVPFSSEANRAAIRAALVKLKATNTFVP